MIRLHAIGVLTALLAVGTAPPVGPLPATAVAASAVRFESGHHARIPFALRSQHVWVRGRINDSDSLWIVIDTGASATVMDAELARSLGLRTVGQNRAMGAGGSVEGDVVANATVRLPGLSFHVPRIGALPLTTVSGPGRPMQVVVGHELFASCVVRFDYEAGVLDVWDAADAPAHAEGVEVPLTFEQGHPYVEGILEVAGRAPISGRFVIDTGSSRPLMILPEVARRESLQSAFPRTLASMGRGVGGEVHSVVGRAAGFSIGTLRFERPVVVLTEPGGGRISAPGTIGNIGEQLLERCRVTFDYSRRRLVLEPATGFDRPWEADMSGLVIMPEGAAWRVRAVNPGTPAEEAGLRVGDLVLGVDGEPAERLELWAIRLRLQEEGREVLLDLQRGDERFSAKLRLRRLI